MSYGKRFLLVPFVLAAVAWPLGARAADWPAWRHDANRSAASPAGLADRLHLQWTRRLPVPRPAFPKYPRLSFDASYEPVVMGKTMFVPSMVTDSVTALDTDTGVVRWRFCTNGPVRFAPVAWRSGAAAGKVCFVSDDGWLYCLSAADGKVLWKFRGLPAGQGDRKVLGNGRLISNWPARGAPVLADGKIYFAAGIWPVEGIYIYALDAATGRVVWVNKGTGLIKNGLIDHSSRRDAGLSPQGYLAIIGDRLIVPSGRALPGVLEAKTGKLGPYSTAWGGRQNLEKGCWYVSAIGKFLFQSGDVWDWSTRKRLKISPANAKELGEFPEPVLTQEAIYYSPPVNKKVGDSYRPIGVGYQAVVACQMNTTTVLRKDKRGKMRPVTIVLPELWRMPAKVKVHIKAGARLYAGAAGMVAAIDLPKPGVPPSVSWRATIQGTPSRMLAADEKLFVVTREGAIYAFGAKKVSPKTHSPPTPKPAPPADEWTAAAKEILKRTGVADGYCLLLGLGTGRLADEIIRQSKLHVIALDPDAEKVADFREKFAAAGLYGTRIAVHAGTIGSYPFPPYLADLIVSEDRAALGPADGDFARRIFRPLRPYGGMACLAGDNARKTALVEAFSRAKLPGAAVAQAGGMIVLTRRGALAGSADWTHEGADAGGTFVSTDKRVKAPLEVLWFGGSIDMAFPDWDYTHSMHPFPLVVGGRLFMQVRRQLHAADVYTGRRLWTATLPAPKTRRRGYAYAAAADGIYVACDKVCLRLDPATGRKVSSIEAPGAAAAWGGVRIWKDALIGAVGRTVVAVNRNSGKLLWRVAARGGLGGFAVGGGKVFLADRHAASRRGPTTQPAAKIVAIDAGAGNILWQANLPVKTGKRFPLHISYSAANDMVIASHESVSAFSGRDGRLLWDRVIVGRSPLLLHRNRVISQEGQMFDPATGKQLPGRLWKGPTNKATRGCNIAIGGEYLVMVRDAHSSYFDLADLRQTFFRGIRSGCTNSLIAAGGLLNSPNYARGCSCNYSIFTSVAWVHAGGR